MELAATALGLAGQLPAQTDIGLETGEDAHPPTPSGHDQAFLRVLLHRPDGTPLEPTLVKTAHARDLPNDALPQAIVTAEGRIRIALAAEPFQVSCRLQIPNFGEVYCYADNNGKGYTKPATIEFVIDAARTRLRRVREVFEHNRHGLAVDPEFEKHFETATHLLPKESSKAGIGAAYESLAYGLHAGERLALNVARARIAKFPEPRKDFLFGCATSGWNRYPEFEKRFKPAFNFGTLSWYSWKNEQPEAERIDYGRMDQSLQWCLDRKIAPKGFGYVYLMAGATPEWLRSWPHDKVLAEYKRVVAQTARRYAGRMPYLEVINEAHDKANLFRFSHAQIVELTREACQAARDGAPEIKRLINNCCLWAEYVKRPNGDGSRRWSPFRYLSDCVKAGTEFERVGLQLYYPQQDLFEIERMLNRFTAFKRPIHITEIACNSVNELDPASMRPKDFVPGWHGPWNETMQADWMEGIYTLCYSKPEFEAIGWWDFADYDGHFWPSGGLLHKDFSPKESYYRLLNLQKDWGVAQG